MIFTNNPGRNSVWIVMHPSIHLRMELDGSEVKIDDRVVLGHASTNKCLSVNEERSNRYLNELVALAVHALCWFRSPYGREYELICELSTANNDSYKSPIFWRFQTQSAYWDTRWHFKSNSLLPKIPFVTVCVCVFFDFDENKCSRLWPRVTIWWNWLMPKN